MVPPVRRDPTPAYGRVAASAGHAMTRKPRTAARELERRRYSAGERLRNLVFVVREKLLAGLDVATLDVALLSDAVNEWDRIPRTPEPAKPKRGRGRR